VTASRAPTPSSQALAGDEKYATVTERSSRTTDHTNDDTQIAMTTAASTDRRLDR
jgi:hypothetical protein